MKYFTYDVLNWGIYLILSQKIMNVIDEEKSNECNKQNAYLRKYNSVRSMRE